MDFRFPAKNTFTIKVSGFLLLLLLEFSYVRLRVHRDITLWNTRAISMHHSRKERVTRDESCPPLYTAAYCKSNLRKIFQPPTNISLRNKNSRYRHTNLEIRGRQQDKKWWTFFQHAGHDKTINILIGARTQIFQLDTQT